MIVHDNATPLGRDCGRGRARAEPFAGNSISASLPWDGVPPRLAGLCHDAIGPMVVDWHRMAAQRMTRLTKPCPHGRRRIECLACRPPQPVPKPGMKKKGAKR